MRDPEQIRLMMLANNEVLASLPNEKCRNCPAVLGLAAKIALASWENHTAKQEAEILVDNRFDELGVAAAEMMGVPADLMHAEALARRQSQAEKLDLLDAEIEKMTTEVCEITESCSGVLKMRATRDDATYTTTICTAPGQYLDDSPRRIYPSMIQRKTT